jgi:nucleoside-diphosphate-sugar epimerase
MKALVTGGIGTVGKSVLERLARHGWETRVLDRTPEGDVPELGLNISYRAGDITQFNEVRDAVRGCDAIVHLAAIANPMFVPPHELFHINVQGTYNVFEAAASEGISRIVQASSINAFGCFWGNRVIFQRSCGRHRRLLLAAMRHLLAFAALPWCVDCRAHCRGRRA